MSDTPEVTDGRTFALAPSPGRPKVFEGTLPGAPIRPGTLTATWLTDSAWVTPWYVTDDGCGNWMDSGGRRLPPPVGLVYAVDYTTGRCTVDCRGAVCTPPGVVVQYRVETVDAFAPRLTGTACGAPGCGKPQFHTPHGDVCDNGHGGAPPRV